MSLFSSGAKKSLITKSHQVFNSLIWFIIEFSTLFFEYQLKDETWWRVEEFKIASILSSGNICFSTSHYWKLRLSCLEKVLLQ